MGRAAKVAAVVALLSVLCAGCTQGARSADSAPVTPPVVAAAPALAPSAASALPTPTPAPVSTASPLPASPATAAVERGIPYCTNGGVTLALDLCRPPAGSPPAPVVLYIHGGGWREGDRTSDNIQQEAPLLAARGYLVASMDYRLAPRYRFPAQIEDAKCAVRFLRANSSRFNLDPQRVGVMGASVGGHLAALLGLTSPDAGFEGAGGYADQPSSVQAVVDLFGPADLPRLFLSPQGAAIAAQVFGADQKSVVRASPVTYVTAAAPPFLIIQGDRDTTVPPDQSQVLYDKLRAAGVPAELVLVRNAQHGLAPAGGDINPSRADLFRRISEFLDQHLR